MTRPAQLVVCLAALLLLNACAGYRLGPTAGTPSGARSIEVLPFVNETMEPRLGDAVTSAMRRHLQRDATYRLATRGNPDILLTGVLTRFTRFELSLLPEDVLTARDFRISVTAHITARDTNTGQVLLDEEITGYTLIRIGTDLTSSERQALPLLAEDLARNATARIVDGSW
jgi:hypothetical protein